MCRRSCLLWPPAIEWEPEILFCFFRKCVLAWRCPIFFVTKVDPFAWLAWTPRHHRDLTARRKEVHTCRVERKWNIQQLCLHARPELESHPEPGLRCRWSVLYMGCMTSNHNDIFITVSTAVIHTRYAVCTPYGTSLNLFCCHGLNKL